MVADTIPSLSASAASLTGMTGFGRAEGALGPASWTWELRSVNGRGLDVRVRLAPGFEALEPAVRAALKDKLARGSVTVNLSTRRDAGQAARTVSLARARAVALSLRPLVRAGLVAPVTAGDVLGVKGVVDAHDDVAPSPEETQALHAAALESFNVAVDDLIAARAAEGAQLAAIVSHALDRIAGHAGKARRLAEGAPQTLADRLRAQLADLQGEGGVSEERLAQEIALLAAKADVREELDRLDAHVESGRTLLAGEGARGRKLEFLIQEFMREANTLCSKSSDMALTAVGLELKTVIDQMREQAANVA